MIGTAGLASAPETSLRPMLRPGSATAPELKTGRPVQSKEAQSKGLMRALRPLLRPRSIRREARQQKKLLKKGAVCGDLSIQGQAVGRVPGRLAACGINDAVKISAVNGVVLSQKAVMNCQTAQALNTWVKTGLRPAVGNQGGGVSSLRVVAHYACRTRNNRKGAKISEHGKGNAIDIAGIGLKNGSELTVLSDWGRGKDGRILKKAHRAACGPFGTVLGPKADRFHRDHFHLDTARHRGGAYCR